MALFTYVQRRIAHRSHTSSEISSKLIDNPALRKLVEAKLTEFWSLEQIAGCLRVEYPDDESMRVSQEAIYLALYAKQLVARSKQRHRKRRPQRRRHRRKNQGQGRIHNPIMISDRPAHVEERVDFGHWESHAVVRRHTVGAQSRGQRLAVAVRDQQLGGTGGLRCRRMSFLASPPVSGTDFSLPPEQELLVRAVTGRVDSALTVTIPGPQGPRFTEHAPTSHRFGHNLSGRGEGLNLARDVTAINPICCCPCRERLADRARSHGSSAIETWNDSSCVRRTRSHPVERADSGFLG